MIPVRPLTVVYVNSIYPLGSAQIVNLKNGDCLSGTHSALTLSLCPPLASRILKEGLGSEPQN